MTLTFFVKNQIIDRTDDFDIIIDTTENQSENDNEDVEVEDETENQIIERTDDFEVVADSVNYLKAKFTFTEDWTGFTKLISFRHCCTVVSTVLDENDEITIPFEVVKNPGFIFSLVGIKDDVKITTNVYKIRIKESGYEEGASPDIPPIPIYEGLIGGQARMVLGKNSDADFDYNFKWIQDFNYNAEMSMDDRLNLLVPKRLNVIPTLDDAANNDTAMLYVDNNGIDSKISISGLRTRMIKQGDEIPANLQKGEYLFLEIKEE